MHYKNVSKETIFERSIAEKISLRQEKLDEFGRKEHNIKKKLFKEGFTNYRSPSNMYKKLSETESAEINQIRVDFF